MYTENRLSFSKSSEWLPRTRLPRTPSWSQWRVLCLHDRTVFSINIISLNCFIVATLKVKKRLVLALLWPFVTPQAQFWFAQIKNSLSALLLCAMTSHKAIVQVPLPSREQRTSFFNFLSSIKVSEHWGGTRRWTSTTTATLATKREQHGAGAKEVQRRRQQIFTEATRARHGRCLHWWSYL